MSRTYLRYTDKQKDFLRDNIESNSYQVLTEKFNARFGTDVSIESIKDLCIKRMKIHRGKNTGLFYAGQKRTSLDVGATVIRDGYTFIKTNDIRHDGTYSYADMKENWMPYQKYIYEQRYGKVPDGCMVVFLDGNKNNFDIENLYCISRKINCVMNKKRWFSENRDLTLAAIKWCELFYAMKPNYQEKEG